MKYYYLSWIDNRDVKAARAPEGTLNFELADIMKCNEELPFVLDLEDDAELLDYQPNTIAWPLMSEKLKNVISENLTGKEGLSWISAQIKHKGAMFKYFIPRFAYKLDILFDSKSIFAGKDFVVKAHLSLTKVRDYSFFPLPDLPFTSRNVVCEELKKKIESHGLSGINFEKAAAS